MEMPPSPEENSDAVFAARMADIPRSFLREILKVATAPGMISLAGGCPTKTCFPLRRSEQRVIKFSGFTGRMFSSTAIRRACLNCASLLLTITGSEASIMYCQRIF